MGVALALCSGLGFGACFVFGAGLGLGAGLGFGDGLGLGAGLGLAAGLAFSCCFSSPPGVYSGVGWVALERFGSIFIARAFEMRSNNAAEKLRCVDIAPEVPPPILLLLPRYRIGHAIHP